MNEYELTVLIHPDLEANLDAALDKVRALIKDNGGEMYVYFEVKLPSNAPLKISNVLNITDEVLRYLLVKTDEKTRRALAEQKEREAKAATEAADEEA